MIRNCINEAVKMLPLSLPYGVNRSVNMIPISLPLSRYNRITGIRVPSEIQNKTISQILSEEVNYSVFLDKEQFLKIIKYKKPNDTFLL